MVVPTEVAGVEGGIAVDSIVVGPAVEQEGFLLGGLSVDMFHE